MIRRALALAIVLLSGAVVGRAEVRVADDGNALALQVAPVAGHVWSPRGRLEADVINSEGDVFADGYPGYASHGDGLVAAWYRGSTDELVFLSTTRGRAHVLWSIAADGSVSGVPAVSRVNGGWLIAAQSGNVDSSIHLWAIRDGSGDVESVDLGQGSLLGTVTTGKSLQVVSSTSDRSLRITTVSLALPGGPLPIDLFALTLPTSLDSLSAASTLTSISACMNELARDSNGIATTALVVWRGARGEGGFAVLDEQGVVSEPHYMSLPNGSCQALLNSAKRALR